MFAYGKGRVAGWRKEKRPRKKGKGGKYTRKEKGKETYRSPASCFYVSIHGVFTFQLLVLTATTFGRSERAERI